MRYDFTKVQEAISLNGKTLAEMEKLTGINNGTISRVLRTGRAHQSTALKLVNVFHLSMKDIQVRSNGKKTA